MVLVGNLRQIVHFALGMNTPVPHSQNGVALIYPDVPNEFLPSGSGTLYNVKVFLVPVGHPILKHVVGLCGIKIVV